MWTRQPEGLVCTKERNLSKAPFWNTPKPPNLSSIPHPSPTHFSSTMDDEHEAFLGDAEANLTSAKHSDAGCPHPQHLWTRCSSKLDSSSDYKITYGDILMSGNDSRMPFVTLRLRKYHSGCLALRHNLWSSRNTHGHREPKYVAMSEFLLSAVG